MIEYNKIWDFLKDIFLYDENAPVLFTRFYFWAFFALLLVGYSIIYKKNTIRNSYLFILSLFFYYKSGGYFFTILIFSTIVDYSIGLLIFNANKKYAKKIFVVCSILVNLLLLAYFKYTYFFNDIGNQVLLWAYDFFGISGAAPQFEVVNLLALWSNELTGSNFDATTIILPVGISFYTFQTISYSVDVYRKKLEPVRNILDFGFYVTFFPQLVAGPIVRAAEFIPQLYRKYSVTIQEYGHAVFLILNGLMKKMIISDYLSTNFVDRVFENPLSYTGFENLMATYGYSIQIYCDFSGYTDIAIGVALLLGFRLPLNFNSPYKAENITDFWRRWHISLSSWLRDYLYIPLGGSRKGKIRTYINLLVTMLLGGLWHGAAFRFVIWGGIHGAGLAIHKLWQVVFPPKSDRKSLFMHFVSVFFTFHVVTFAWLFFRAGDMETVGKMLNQMFLSFSPELIPEIISSYKMIFIVLFTGFFIHWLPSSLKERYRGAFINSSIIVKAIIAVLVVILIYQFKSSEIQPFIYFQF
ncbi:MAG: MBOAT family O-acyltransferase [Bacteroidota bacterium]